MESQPEHINPYASPLAEDAYQTPGSIEDLSSAEVIRREHLNREASIKSIGLICYLGAAVLAFAAPGALLELELWQVGRWNAAALGALTAVVLVACLAALHVYLGRALRRLTPAARPWTIVLAAVWFAISLASFNPVTGLLSAYYAWLVSGRRATYVFSPEYKQVIAATPHIKYKTSIVAWVVLGVVLLLLALAIVSAAVARY